MAAWKGKRSQAIWIMKNLVLVRQSGNGITLELGDDQKEDVQKAILQNTRGEGLQRVELPGRQ